MRGSNRPTGDAAARPFEWVNPTGAGPGLIVCDHAGNAIPADYGGLGLDAAALADHIAWDVGAGDLARRLAAALDMPALLARLSRLFIDCNRNLGHPELVPGESDGVPIPGNRAVSAAEIAKRRARVYDPYHDAIARWLDARMAEGGVPAILSVHSMTKRLRAGALRPWEICVLWNRDGRIARPLLEALEARPNGFVIGDNQPYSARIDPGETIPRHAEARGLPHVIFEIRNDRLAGPEGVDRIACTLEPALAGVLGDPDLYEIRRW